MSSSRLMGAGSWLDGQAALVCAASGVGAVILPVMFAMPFGTYWCICPVSLNTRNIKPPAQKIPPRPYRTSIPSVLPGSRTASDGSEGL
jgi:hypothetical protein